MKYVHGIALRLCIVGVCGVTLSIPILSTSQVVRPPSAYPCYVQLWNRHYFEGESVLLYGPGVWPSLQSLSGSTIGNWNDEADSLLVGPRAVLRTWEDEQFAGDVSLYGPSTQEGNVREDIQSLEITCRPW